MFTSSKVAIQVQSVYIESQSSPEEQRYVFAYTITIHNLNKHAIRLLRRYWFCLLYTSPSPRDRQKSRMPSSA